MGDTGQPPPGMHQDSGKASGEGTGTKTYASVLGRSLTTANESNVLEVVLEKDSRGGFLVTDIECSILMRKLGLEQRPGGQVLGVQICPNGRGVIYITFNKGVDIGKYCRYDVMDVTKTGIRAVLVKPAGRREAVVTLRGIHPSTKDDVVLEYLSKFAQVVSRKVVYGVFTEGPLMGLRNGDRNYKLEIKPSTNLGSYHVLDGQRVTLKYQGQQQTCARCLKTAQHCRGKGVAKKCEAEGGHRADFNNYILELWKQIGYSPRNEQEEDDAITDAEENNVTVGEGFTPLKVVSDPEKFTGVRIKNIPKDTDHGRIAEFIVLSGLPEDKRENITIDSNGSTTIKGLDNQECLTLISNIHWKKSFDRKLYCNGYIQLTPEKEAPQPSPTAATITPSLSSSNSPGGMKNIHPCSPARKLLSQSSFQQVENEISGSNEATENLPVAAHTAKSIPEFQGSPTSSPPDWSTSNLDWSEENDEALVRRYSLSLTDRTPPENSLAADILGAQLHNASQVHQQHVQQVPLIKNSLMSSIKDIQEALSDFKSCNSTTEESYSLSESNDDLKNTAAVRRKRKKRSKNNYSREDFIKKQDTKVSPK